MADFFAQARQLLLYAAMPECAVVGSPIAHSRSPVLHRAADAALGLTDWSYERVELHAGELRSWLAGLGDNWRGVSVTMPLKQEAVTGADTASDLAADLRAANTLIRGVGGWHADNTYVAGLSGAIRELGAGDARSTRQDRSVAQPPLSVRGTAAAAVAALADFGVEHVDVVLRNAARGRELVTLAERLGLKLRIAQLADGRCRNQRTGRGSGHQYSSGRRDPGICSISRGGPGRSALM